MTDEEKEVAWERINDQRREDELARRIISFGLKKCASCGALSVGDEEQRHFLGCQQ